MAIDMETDVFADLPYGKLALKKLTEKEPLHPDFRLYEAGWLGDQLPWDDNRYPLYPRAKFKTKWWVASANTQQEVDQGSYDARNCRSRRHAFTVMQKMAANGCFAAYVVKHHRTIASASAVNASDGIKCSVWTPHGTLKFNPRPTRPPQPDMRHNYWCEKGQHWAMFQFEDLNMCDDCAMGELTFGDLDISLAFA